MASIKWTKGQNKKLQKAVKRYNAKIEREMKKNPALEETTIRKRTVKELKQEISTANDLNVILRELDRAFGKKAFEVTYTQGGFPLTRYEITNTRLQVQRINKARKKQREKIPEKPEYYGTVEVIKKQALPDRRVPDFDNIKKEQWDKIAASLRNQQLDNYYENRDQQFKDNYIKALRENFGSNAIDIIDLLSNISGGDMIKEMYGNYDLSIDFIYAPEEAEAKLQLLLETWENIVYNRGF